MKHLFLVGGELTHQDTRERVCRMYYTVRETHEQAIRAFRYKAKKDNYITKGVKCTEIPYSVIRQVLD